MSETDVKGTVLGFDAECKMIRIGDTVEHTVKDLGRGVVVKGGLFYKDEVACKVDFEKESGWTARLSKLRVVPPAPAKKTLADFGYKVGDKVKHLKYGFTTEITSEEVGVYKGEPCCFTGAGRPTRFSQIEPMAAQQKAFDAFLDQYTVNTQIQKKAEAINLTLPSGKVVRIEIE